MPITINTNASASYANFHLGRNQSALQKSLTRLSSGSRIVQPVDDAGGLAVSLKLQSAITRLDGAQKNVQNAISFLEVQDGVLEAAGKIMNRMIELKGLSDGRDEELIGQRQLQPRVQGPAAANLRHGFAEVQRGQHVRNDHKRRINGEGSTISIRILPSTTR